ncbi:hypothetical protein DM860_015558 [Cuscuta australis]|uniref:Cytokinin riboside 5'-monophosphate phosphoribohydrolase n=1 Tax=Cuscuta australis TaxID=267555 RepID=A0A328EAH8_9ASTE|nr:hypothetical protein DM860_015558 [Cuscuta australis]
MEGTSRAPSYTIRFIGILGSHALGRNSKFMATSVDLGRELMRRKIRLTYGGGNVGLQGVVASIVSNNGGIDRGFIPGHIASQGVYGPTYGAEYTVSITYYKYFEMNHVVEAFIVLPGGVDTIEGLFTLISWASEGLHSRPIGLLNIDGYFNNLIKFLDDAVRQNFMASSQRKLFISSFFIDELLNKLEFAKSWKIRLRVASKDRLYRFGKVFIARYMETVPWYRDMVSWYRLNGDVFFIQLFEATSGKNCGYLR